MFPHFRQSVLNRCREITLSAATGGAAGRRPSRSDRVQRKPGAFAVRDANDNSVLRMVALSEGLMPFAAKEAYIYRRDEKGAKQEIPVALEKIMQRKSPDVTLETDDVFYVPDNKTRRTTFTVIDRITAFGSATASGLLIWH